MNQRVTSRLYLYQESMYTVCTCTINAELLSISRRYRALPFLKAEPQQYMYREVHAWSWPRF